MDNNEIKLPDSLENLIKEEKRKGIRSFESSDFEKKIYNRIRDQRGGSQISFRLILIPASLVLILISSVFLFRGSRDNSSVQNKLQFALETVIRESDHSQYISPDLIKERGKFETLQKEIFTSIGKSEIGIRDLSRDIASTLLSASGENEPDFRFSPEHQREDLLYIKEDISNMNKKNDYSELFSGIIDKLTEG